MVPTAAWVKSGKIVGNTNNFGKELSLYNVSKDVSGTYICRAQLYSMIDEISTEITVYCKCYK